MAILPGYDEVSSQMSDTQFSVYMSIHWFLILFYAVLIMITIANIWQILIKQDRWKTLPLLVFYLCLHSSGAEGVGQPRWIKLQFLVLYSTSRKIASWDNSVVDDVRDCIETTPRHHTGKKSPS